MTDLNPQTHFDQIANKYDDFKSSKNIYYQVMKKAVINKNRNQKKIKILDIGCGTGNILAEINPAYGLGIDISWQMIKLAKLKYARRKNLHFKVYDIEKKSIPGSFDYLLFIDVIEHLFHHQAAFKNIGRTMHSQTTLLVSMANPLWEPALLLLEKFHLKMPEGPHQRISENKLLNLCSRNHLRLLSKQVYFPDLKLPVIKNLGLIYLYSFI